ncbi:hypothetical protein B0J11DRAFT_555198 [Dendryphion nanum]|uniref:Uncharacterized protein n=1 Tax=Dendryphion nanum TaxID=256645 RepID=A0A9P9EF99_9PLEO|nr:hypothetical protein B0J11DRAFT_555198 [Dendryphion nanum]
MPSFRRSPRPDQAETPLDGSPASQSSSRFGGLHNNVRSMINGSSVYSNSPAPSNNNTPKLPFLGFFRRPPPSPIEIPPPRQSTDSRSPLRPQHTAGSYMRAIAPLQDPPEPQAIYNRHPADRHPADVQLGQTDSHSQVDPEIQQLQDEINGRRRRRHRHHRRRKHQQRPNHWTQAARGKALACTLSGLFLITVLAIYLALALTNRDLGQEIHVLFIMVILAITIFFCHSLIRLCMLMLHPPVETPRIPSMTGPDGFRPVQPIRVHLARDEELESRPATPAYGLWRSSVRVDPNLLHWQRVEERNATPPPPPHPASRNGSLSGPSGAVVREVEPVLAPRPPSYASEDGVSYIMEAAPRSTVGGEGTSGMSDIHPAWRPGYAVSEVRLDEWPGARR